MTTRRTTVLAGVLALLVLAGCGGTTIDARKAERAIAADYESQVDGAQVTSVRCPDEIDPEPGTRFGCTMRLADGSTGRIGVRVVDDAGNLRWDVEPAD
ncbi:DUF4333 domain-containing protein [Solicola sp. PLA-1-18]|uniref:DUF4333 domain-containing protein n=1 Tax=Solicola sp. PLA-1-18 TaxID=3380532 RepID=UPI003B7BCFC5